MSHTVRQATVDDVAAIVPWTTDTFSWGDYVPDRLPSWLEDDNSAVLVATVDDEPVALVHVVMLSSTEGFLEAARVHPDYRRRGIGNDLNVAAVEWARSRGAQVARLATEATNTAAVDQVMALGFRQTTEWTHCTLQSQPAIDDDMLRLAGVQDVDVAWMSWSSNDLYVAARGLIALGWQFRKAHPNDLRDAAEAGQLYQSPAGWLMADVINDRLRVSWFASSRHEAPTLLSGLRRLGSALEVEQVSIKTPVIPWMDEALIRAGAELDRLFVFEKPS